MKRKVLATVLAAALLLSLSPFMMGAAITSDGDHWADGSIEACDEMGVLEELAKSEYSPDEKASRGDMFKMMDNIMNYPDKATNKSFSDLDSTHPHYDTLMKLAAAGIAQGYEDGTMRPDGFVTREEAMVIFARAFGVAEDANAVYSFTDGDAIGGWAKPLVGGLYKLGYVNGYPDGSFGPKLNVTMGELAQMIDNLLADVVSSAGTYTENFGSGYTVVNVPGVTLQNLTVEGDLIAAVGIGTGDLVLDSVKVTGRLIVKGGGVNSIIIKGDSSVVTIVIDSETGGVSIKVQDGADVEIIYVDDGSDEVFIEGTVGELQIGYGVDVTVQSGATVGSATINGDNSTLTIANGASVGDLGVYGDNNNVVVNGTLENGNVSGSNSNISGTGEITGTVTYESGENNQITVVGTAVEVADGAGAVAAGSETIASGDDGVVPDGTTPATGDTGSTGGTGGGTTPPVVPAPGASLSVTVASGTSIFAIPEIIMSSDDPKDTKLDETDYTVTYGVDDVVINAIRAIGGIPLTYSQSNITGDNVRLNVTLTAGDESKAYLFATNGTRTFELIKTGYMGVWDGQSASDFDTVTSLTFLATAPGMYTLEFTLVDVSMVNSEYDVATTKTAGTPIATTTLTLTVLEPEAVVVNDEDEEPTFYATVSDALTAAVEGEMVGLLKDATLNGNATVKAGVEMVIPDGIALTVAANSKITVAGTLIQYGADSTSTLDAEGVLDLSASTATLEILSGGLWSVRTGLVGSGTATIKSGGCYFSYGSEISTIGPNTCKIVHESGSYYYYGAVNNNTLPTTKEAAKTSASAIFLEPGLFVGGATKTTARWVLGEGAKIIITRSGAALCTEIVTGTTATQWGQIKGAAGFNTTISGTGEVVVPSNCAISIVAGQTVTINAGAKLTVEGTLKIAGTLSIDGGTIAKSGNGIVVNGAGAEITAAFALIPLLENKTQYSVIGTNNATGKLVYLTALGDEDDTSEYLYYGALSIDASKKVFNLNNGTDQDGYSGDTGLYYVNIHKSSTPTYATIYCLEVYETSDPPVPSTT